MTEVYLGLGSNVGDRFENIQRAVTSIAELGEITAVSDVYETEPWGKTDQSAFLNACIQLQTERNPEDLLSTLKQIEIELGRVERERWGPREIDIDILFHADTLLQTQRLTIPHPLLHERAFVLKPLSDIAPDFMHPVHEKTIRELLQSVPTKGLEKTNKSIQLPL